MLTTTTGTSLAQRLRLARYANGMSQAVAAAAVGTSPTAYGRWEQGQIPNPRSIPALAEFLGVDRAALAEDIMRELDERP